jgi:hypothetical protein
VNHGFAVFEEFLVVFAQPTSVAEPSERAFNNPAFGKNLKTGLPFELSDDLQDPTTPPPQPLHELPGITTVRPIQLHRRKQCRRLEKQQFGPIPILDCRGMHHHCQQQPQRIDQDMPLATVDLLPRIVPMYPPFSVVFTDWLSTIPAVGSGSFPSATRTARRRASFIYSHNPALVHSRK